VLEACLSPFRWQYDFLQLGKDGLKEFAAPKTGADVRDLLAESIVELRAGKLDPKVAIALGYLGTSLLRALECWESNVRLPLPVGWPRITRLGIVSLSWLQNFYSGPARLQVVL
jgi:hypothetical protein